MGQKTSFLIITAILMILAGADFAQAGLSDGLIAHWTFDDAGGTTAVDLVGGNDGTLINGPTWATGHIGGALEFDGTNDYVGTLNNIFSNAQLASGATLSAWFKTDSTAYSLIADMEGYLNLGINFVAVPNPGKLFGMVDGGHHRFFSDSDVTDNNWHHAAIVWDGAGTATLYLDGVNVSSGSSGPPTPDMKSRPFAIGTHSALGAYYDGIIDDVRVYDRALSADEVGQLSGIELIGLDIEGADAVAENSQAQYKAIAYYNNDSAKDVTNLAVWSVEPNTNSSIAAGILTTEAIDVPQDVIITAQYSAGDVNESDEKDVSIFAICSSGSALEFDGTNDYVSVEDAEAFNFGADTDFSISAWIKTDGTDSWPYTAIIDKHKAGHSPYEGFMLYLHKTGHLIFVISDSSGLGTLDSKASVIDNNWHFITVVADRDSNCEIYIDGNYDSSLPISAIGNINTNIPLAFGRSMDYNGQYFGGSIDEVCIFDRALSTEDIKVLMHMGPDANDMNLVGQWDFNEGSGQVVVDSTGDNDGQLGNSDTPDDRDPNWIDSDAPFRICTIEGLVERNLLNVLDMKEDVLDILDEAIGKEEVLWEYMDAVFKNRNFGNTGKNDVAKAKQKIHSAIKQETQAETAVDRSIDNLNDALNSLGIEE